MEWDSCDHCITEKELLNSLKQPHNGKTPGTDGLALDFYNKKIDRYSITVNRKY